MLSKAMGEKNSFYATLVLCIDSAPLTLSDSFPIAQKNSSVLVWYGVTKHYWFGTSELTEGWYHVVRIFILQR